MKNANEPKKDKVKSRKIKIVLINGRSILCKRIVTGKDCLLIDEEKIVPLVDISLIVPEEY